MSLIHFLHYISRTCIYFLVVIMCCSPLINGLKCWECISAQCSGKKHWHPGFATERDCPSNFVCQKTIFHFFYNTNELDSSFKVKSSVVRGCASTCTPLDETKTCDTFRSKLSHPHEDQHGCVERYCCSSDLCNRSTVPVVSLFILPFLYILVNIALRCM